MSPPVSSSRPTARAPSHRESDVVADAYATKSRAGMEVGGYRRRVIYQHPLAYLLGVEGLALLRRGPATTTRSSSAPGWPRCAGCWTSRRSPAIPAWSYGEAARRRRTASGPLRTTSRATRSSTSTSRSCARSSIRCPLARSWTRRAAPAGMRHTWPPARAARQAACVPQGRGGGVVGARSQSASRTKKMKHRNAVRSPRWGGKSSRGVPGAADGSLRTERRKPASVNASVMACNGRCQ